MRKLYFLLLIIFVSLNAMAEMPGVVKSVNLVAPKIELPITTVPETHEEAPSNVIGENLRGMLSRAMDQQLGNSRVRTMDEASALVYRPGCQEQTCAVTVPEPREHLKFGVSFINYNSRVAGSSAVPKDCNCLVTELNNPTKSQKDVEQTAINHKIIKSYGEKFVNSFSANLEDMTFFMKQSPLMFKDRNKAPALQCDDAGAYSKRVREVCKTRNIDDEWYMSNRMNLFANAVSGGATPFNTKLKFIAEDVVNSIKIPDDVKRKHSDLDRATHLARLDFDKIRHDIAVKDPEAKFLDLLMTRLLNHPRMNEKLTAALRASNSPVEAYKKIIKEEKKTSNPFSGLGLGEGASKFLTDDKSIDVAFEFIMSTHPGYKMALTDKKVFDRVRNFVNPNTNTDILSVINANQDVLEPALQERCHNMIEEFAAAVCTKDEFLIANVNPVELELLLHPEALKGQKIDDKPELHDLVICEARVANKDAVHSAIMGGGALIGLSTAPGMVSSDYMMNQSGRSGTLIGSVATTLATDEKARAEAVRIIDQKPINPPITSPGIIADRVYAQDIVRGRNVRLGSNSMSKEDATKFLAESKKWDDKRVADNAKVNAVPSTGAQTSTVASDDKNQQPSTLGQTQNVASTQTNNVFTPTTSYVAPQTNSKQAAQAREQLRQYIADKNDPTVATKAVSSLDDASAQELNKLRNEKQSLLEQQLKEGEARLKDLRGQLSDAANKVQTPVPDRNVASVDDETSNDDDSSSRTSSGRNPRSIDQQASSIASGSVGGTQASSNAGVASTSGSKSGSVTSSTNVVKDVAETEAQVTASSNAQNDSSGSIVITASDVKASGTLPPQELNQEVQKFLASSTLTSSSIQDIKSKGIKIRFNVMENNKLVQKEVVVKYESLDQETRNQIDLKLARNNVKNQISKLAVLKLLISSSAKR